jgi:hypothetical protein
MMSNDLYKKGRETGLILIRKIAKNKLYFPPFLAPFPPASLEGTTPRRRPQKDLTLDH